MDKNSGESSPSVQFLHSSINTHILTVIVIMKLVLLVLLLVQSVTSLQLFTLPPNLKLASISRRVKKSVTSVLLTAALTVGAQSPSTIAHSATELPSLEKCFNAVRKELDSTQGESLTHIKNDIDQEKWDDLKLFTREYDAGFRGGVLKTAWKQLGDSKQKGISITNSFTFDLIALNKAARTQDKVDAYHRLDQITQDLKDFLALEKTVPPAASFP